jgi:predicted metal-dependent hydrolase
VKGSAAFDHWHRDENDRGRPYAFTTATKLLEDFWAQVKRVMDEKGIPNDL